MDFRVVGRMLMFVRPMLPRMAVVMHMGIVCMRMFMGMLVQMLMQMDYFLMLVFMAVRMGMLMGM